MPSTNTEVTKTPAELLMEMLEAGTMTEGFKVVLEEDFKPLLIEKYAKSEFLPKVSFTIENGKAMFVMLDKAGYLEAKTPLLGLFEVNESQTKWGKKVQYLTTKGDWLKTDALNTVIPNELDVVAGA